mgnify:CR=1 FL=1
MLLTNIKVPQEQVSFLQAVRQGLGAEQGGGAEVEHRAEQQLAEPAQQAPPARRFHGLRL